VSTIRVVGRSLDLANGLKNEFATRVIKWYEKNGRDFPWREPGLDPYKILIAEVMLQKTVAANVRKIYPKFVAKFPSLNSLADAPQYEIEQEIRPLGIYRRRAKALKEMAARLVAKYGGKIPETEEELTALPMVGRYVANAIMCFAFGKDKPLIDINIRRVMKRFYGLTDFKDIEQKLTEFMPKGRSREFNWALLDLASLICTPRAPKHNKCPLNEICQKNV
jgi:A/G-specific adenine glycosylase